ncbi:MAG: hypothetical protein ACI9ON_003744 [Limisphaerales bacterium]|jgi:hypothetical protein
MEIPQQTAQVTGPVSGGTKGWPFAASMLDIAALGYEEAEYLIEGEACRYAQVPGTDWGRDGRWHAQATETAAYRTRFLVYRPTDPEKFNGTVIVTWNNVTAGYELFGADSAEIFEGGYALVCATVQKVGIEGLPPLHQGLAQWDSQRYGELAISGDDYSYDIYTQIGRAVGPARDSKGADPMAGMTVERVIAQGASQSAGRLGTYYNAIAPLTSVFDGYVLSIYFGRGTALEVGEAVVNINDSTAYSSPADQLAGTNLLRDDLAVPAFIVNSELEAIACHGVRQPDSDTLRWWETAGTCHVSQQSRAAREDMAQRDQLVTRPGEESINAVPIAPLYDAAYFHMHHWLKDGLKPPIAPRINFSGKPPVVERDDDGIATGGIRWPQVEAPIATNSAIPLSEDIFAYLGGSSQPFAQSRLQTLYDNKSAFLKQFESAAAEAVAAGFLRPREVARLVQEAADRWPD